MAFFLRQRKGQAGQVAIKGSEIGRAAFEGFDVATYCAHVAACERSGKGVWKAEVGTGEPQGEIGAGDAEPAPGATQQQPASSEEPAS